MIKINLLTPERKAVKKPFSFQASHTLTVVCCLILAGTLMLIGWRFWTLGRDSARLDSEVSIARQETQRLHSSIQQVQQFEQRRAELQERVALIEELRRNQTGPVHMLDQISRSLPDMLWLTGLKQGVDPNEVLIEGRSTSLTNLSDFVANLEGSGSFKRSIEIVSTQVETSPASAGEVIRFQVRATFQPPGSTPVDTDAAPVVVGKKAN